MTECYRCKPTDLHIQNKKLIFLKVVEQHYVGEVGKSITFLLHIISVYSVPNIVKKNQSTYVDTIVK